VATLIASEFMPVSILTPIASDLALTEGVAGQAISVSGLFAVLTSLTISSLTAGVDRRILLLGLTVLMLVSGLMVAFAPTFAVLMAGRALLGIVIGGFWSMSTATVMRLLPEDQVPRGLAMLNGGNALANTVAAPLGSFLGQYIGWRGAFFMVVPLAAITFGWLWRTLPTMPSARGARTASALGVLRRPEARLGMAAAALLFMGQFALFTYLRPFLENVTQLSVSILSLVLLAMGAAGLLGTWRDRPSRREKPLRDLDPRPAADGGDCRRLGCSRHDATADSRAARLLGPDRDSCSGRLVDVAEPDASERCGSGWRADGGRRPAGHHSRGSRRRAAVRRGRPPGGLRRQRRTARRVGAARPARHAQRCRPRPFAFRIKSAGEIR
jgi:hypothetical protein